MIVSSVNIVSGKDGAVVSNQIVLLSNLREDIKTNQALLQPLVYVQSFALVNQKAAAGYPHNIQDVEWYETLPAFNIPLPQYRNATYRGFQVEGDSMLPSIRPNEWVLGKAVPSITEASDSKIYIVVLHDSVLVKKLQKVPGSPDRVRLISLNPQYIPIEVAVKNIQELWLVNSKLTFGIDEPSESSLLRELQQSMEELKGQINSLNA